MKYYYNGDEIMLAASVFAHIALGLVLGLLFIFYFIFGEGKVKVYIETLLGFGGNAGFIFVLYRAFGLKDKVTNFVSIGMCLFSFIISIVLSMIVFAQIIKDKENDGKAQIIRIRDIMLGQTSWVKEFRDKRMEEIDGKLDYKALKQREDAISRKENELSTEIQLCNEEKIKIDELGKNKIRISLPEKKNIVVSKDFMNLMPSYFKDIVRCIINMNNLEKQYFIDNKEQNIDLTYVKSYLLALSSSIMSDIFNNSSGDIRIHFRYFDKGKNGYIKLVAIKGTVIVDGDLTFIPHDENNMISKSFECKRALIKSINGNFDFKGNNSEIWKDYLTFTFYNQTMGGIPFLSFGISLKNETRYKKLFYYLNYMNFFEEYLQDKIDLLHTTCNLEYILYGGESDVKNI